MAIWKINQTRIQGLSGKNIPWAQEENFINIKNGELQIIR